MKTASEQQRIIDQIRSKISEKERYERDIKTAKEKINRNPKDVLAPRDVERAEDWIERIDNDIQRFAGQL